MAFEFEAALVVPDAAAERLSFADQPQNHQHYLIIQRDEESRDAVLPDMENVYIERDDQRFGGYGGIERIRLTQDRLTLQLTPRMEKQMGDHDVLSVRFSGDSFRSIEELVRQIFRGYESRIDRVE